MTSELSSDNTPRQGALGALALPLSFAVIYSAVHTSISRFPPFPPATSDEWLVYAIIAAVPVAFFLNISRKSLPLRQIIALGLLAITFWVMVGERLSPLHFTGILTGFWAGFLLIERQFLLHPHLTSPRQSSFYLATFLLGTAASAILFLGASAKLAILAIAPTTFALFLAILALLSRHPRLNFFSDLLQPRPLFLPFLLAFGGLLIAGIRFAQAPLGPVLLLAAGLLIIAHLRATLPRLLLAILLSSAAIGWTYADTQRPAETSEYDPYSW